MSAEHIENEAGAWLAKRLSSQWTQTDQAAFDASVSYVRLDAWNSEVTETNKNRLWCYPGSPDGRDPHD